MRDVKLITQKDNEWGIDLDIIDGEPAWLDEAGQTTDQRAAVSVYTMQGTLPGMLGYGVAWGDVYNQSMSIVDLNNQVQQQLDSYADVSDDGAQGVDASQSYIPYMLADESGIGIAVVKGGAK